MTGSAQSPVSRLVLFMVCLSVAGAFIAGLHYYAVDLPQQSVVKAPENDGKFDSYDECNEAYFACLGKGSTRQCDCIRRTCDFARVQKLYPEDLARMVESCYKISL